MESTLGISELLQHILAHLDSKDLSVTATVNQQWSELSLDILWRNLKSLRPVCGVLCPLHDNGNGYQFSRSLRHSDWVRLDHYAYRIRTLSHIPSSSYASLSSAMFDQMARTRPRLDLFPNLRHLQWGFNLFDCLLFVHPRLHSLSITLPSNFVSVASDFSAYLANRLPNMEVLSFTAVFPINGVDEALTSTIRDLSGLRVVHLPTAPTKRVLETLSQLPSLEKVTLRPFQGTPSIRDIGDLKFEIDAFASLRDITLSLPYFAATKLILHPNFPTHLTHVQIESPSVESPAHFSDLLGAISGRNGSMTSVRIVCLSMAGSTRPEQGDFINMRHMRPVLKCTKIRSLELAHYYPLDLIPADLEEIASAFPHLETLVLNCSPVDITPPGVTPLPISSILALTRCPELQRLGLYFSSEFIPRNTPDTVFPHFKSLLVGKSTVANPCALAFFLSHLCPRLINVVMGTNWMQDDREPPVILSPEWEEFAKWLPLLSEIRAEERAWAQHQLRALHGKLTAPGSD